MMLKEWVGRVPEKGSNLGEYQKRVIEFGQVPEKGLGEYRKSDRIWANTRRIRASIGKVIESRQVPEGSGRVPKK